MLDFAAFVFLNLLGAMSPGPDFAIVARYGLSGSRRSALLATLGIGAALLIHVSYCLLGIAILVQNTPRLFHSIQTGGALYLGYLGIMLILSKGGGKLEGKRGHRKAFADGFLTNLLNPKATLFLLSLFAEFVPAETSLGAKAAYGAAIPLIAVGWFSFLSCFLTHPRFLSHLQRYQILFMRTMGALLIGLSGIILCSVLRKLG